MYKYVGIIRSVHFLRPSAKQNRIIGTFGGQTEMNSQVK